MSNRDRDRDRDRPGPIDDDSSCARCSNKPANSYYVGSSNDNVKAEFADKCQWTCADGFFSRAGSIENVCQPCTPMTNHTCRPGFRMTACSALQNMDASCSQECDADAHGKPVENSEWVWTMQLHSLQDGNVVLATEVENPTGGVDGMPNEGCLWRCKEGYALVELDAGGGTGVLNISEDSMSSTSGKIRLCAKKRGGG